MKPAFIHTACAAAMTVMAGAGTAHYFSVGQMVMIAEASGYTGETIAPPESGAAGTASMIAKQRKENQDSQAFLDSTKKDLSTYPALSTSSSEANNGTLEVLLAELIAQNKEMRNQLAETNRDLLDIQFRQDSQAEGFRPLRVVNQDTTPNDSIGVLPPLE